MNEDKRISLEQQKQIQLDVLKNIDSFCREHSIDYSLAFGTLIGAVRHRGYIPWDDDIDIMMTRENYEKFRAVYQSDRYPLADLKNDLTHPVSMGKIFDSQTYFLYKGTIKRKYGLFVDVFPMDNVPDQYEERKEWIKKTGKYIAFNSFKNNGFSYLWGFSSPVKIAAGCVVKLLFSRRFIHDRLERLYKRYADTECSFVGVPAVMAMSEKSIKKVFPKAIFDEYQTIEFEGNQFRCIKDYDQFLSIYYGNYKELPPEEERVGKHGIIAYFR